MHIPANEDFQPTGPTLTKWLATRKPRLNVGGVTMPGFFSDTGNSSDTGWFWIAVVGEIIGLITTLYGGARSGGIFLALAVLATLMFVFCDFFFAVKLHRKKGEECMIDSQLLLTEETHERIRLEEKRAEGRMADFFLESGIIVIAIIKVLGIVLLGIFNNLILYIPFVVIYFIVAYVHIRHTGYYLAFIATAKGIDKEFKTLFTKDGCKAECYKQHVKLLSPLRDVPIKHAPHEIIADDASAFKYTIIARGVLTDRDITNLIGGQESENKIALFRAARSLQIQSYF